MSQDDALELAMRRRIVECVRSYPGLHLREIARQLDTSVALVEYHMPRLEAAALVMTESEEGFIRVYPAAQRAGPLDKASRRHLALLRARLPLKVVLILLEAGAPMRHGELAEAAALGKSTLSFHLNKLVKVGLVHKDPDGRFGLTDQTATERLLIEHRPTPDLRQEFADLWLTFYDG